MGIICDEFMAAIERITSSRTPKWITTRAGQKVKIYVTVWNETLANLSLMALGGSVADLASDRLLQAHLHLRSSCPLLSHLLLSCLGGLLI